MKDTWESTEEAEANYFAMHLLIPTHLLKQEKSIDLANDKAVKRLADKYQVPVAVMVLRLAEFKREKV